MDYHKVKPKERENATQWAQSSTGTALEKDVVKTFVPGAGVHLFSEKEKVAIRQLLEQGVSVQELEEIENSVQRGILPAQLQQQQQTEPALKRQKLE